MSMNIHGRLSRSLISLAAVFAIVTLTSCGQSGKTELAKQGVVQFHAQMNAEQYHAIFVNADERFRRAGPEADFTALMEAIHRKLGTAGQSTLQRFNISWYAGQGTMVTLIYETQFTEGKAGEQFIWRVRDNNPALVGYHINSNLLITK